MKSSANNGNQLLYFQKVAEIALDYYNDLNQFLNVNEYWWREAKKWVDNNYGEAINISINTANKIAHLKLQGLSNQVLESYVMTFENNLEEVDTITAEAYENIRSVRIIDIAQKNNDTIKSFAETASNSIQVVKQRYNITNEDEEDSSDSHAFPGVESAGFSSNSDEKKEPRSYNLRTSKLLARSLKNKIEQLKSEDKEWYSVVESESEEKFGNAISGLLIASEELINYEADYHPTLIATLISAVDRAHLAARNLELYFIKKEDHEIITKFIVLFELALIYLQPLASGQIVEGQEYDIIFNVAPSITVTNSTAKVNSEQHSLFELKGGIHSDEYSIDEEDILGYDLHAANLFNIMMDSKTKPPANIGILAPWGRGKTSLMRKLEAMFVKARESKASTTTKALTQKPTLEHLKQWLKNKGLLEDIKIPHATVWFNPWNYQSSEMIWAGMANAIVEQVVDQLPNQQTKETFWFQLRLARIDKDELRKELQLRATLFSLQFVIWGIALLAAIVAYKVNNTAAWGLVGVFSVLGVFNSVASSLKPAKKEIGEVFEKYTKAPQYLNKLGTYHDVQEDLKKVFNLLVSESEPLVVFVDDLDRCSPSKVVEVVEAINVFISGEHRKKCYFVLGMDAEIVAASLDVAYEKMKGKVINRETEQGSLGWYFLDKFIQLPFFIPVISETKKLEYLESLLKQSSKNQGGKDKSGLTPNAVKDLAKKALSAKSPDESQKILSNLNKTETSEVDKEILKQQVEDNNDDEEISKQVAKYSRYLNSDPRTLKRFANLLRFYNSYQVLRMKKGQKYVPMNFLGKYLALMLKFPQLIRWIQWDTENKHGLSSSADMKAQLIDDAISELLLGVKEEERYRYWKDEKYYQDIKKDKRDKIKHIIEMQKDMTWLKSQGLLNILISENSDEAQLSNALSCNVW